MIKIGMVIGDRYEILEKIGTGGMSDVYKAKDHKLSRNIAVKVLKQEFSENDNFVSKFQIEAQAAAGLMHPNIVNVYDVGEEGGTYYIVMELVEGITLKKYIEKKQHLSVKEAVSIAIQVSMGIEAAHNNHIIHRDIKPQNIIISKEGKVKVTDFGIAKAATSNTITSNVMGSVHYTSPEQARGGYSDARSDIYSLGITLFEMLTGRLPFNGDTTVAIAIKHIQEPFPMIQDYVPEIPVSVRHIVEKCCQKSPDRRYQSMAELIVDLKQSLLNPEKDFVSMKNPEAENPTKTITDREMESIKEQTRRKENSTSEMRLKEDRKPSGQPKKKKQQEVRVEEEYNPKVERITTILAVVAAIIVGLVVIFFVGRAFGVFTFGEKTQVVEEEEVSNAIEVPENLIGTNVDEVKRILLNIGLTPEIQYQTSAESEIGIVLDMAPKSGELVEPGSNVILKVGEGTSGVPVPDVTAKSKAEAKSILTQYGFEVYMVEQGSSSVQAGYVISQTPEENSTAPAGSTITVYVSNGVTTEQKIKVPNVVGMDEMDAVAILTEQGLTVGTITEVNNEDPAMEGKVCYQGIEAETFVAADTMVDLKVSIGPKDVTYQFIENVTAPTEDEEYEEGMDVLVVITSADGVQLLNTVTSAFPISTNYSGIKTENGTITFTFTVEKEAVTVTDPETGETTTTEASSVQKTVTRDITFLQE